MLAHDAIANAQAEAGPLAHFFGGEEWIEDAVRVRDSAAVVGEAELDVRLAHRGGDLDATVPFRLAHRVIRVVDDVEEHLLQLVRVANYGRQFRVEALDHLNAVAGEVVAA